MRLQREGLIKLWISKRRRFKRPTEDTDKIYLNEKELEAIYNLKIPKDKQLESIRDFVYNRLLYRIKIFRLF